MRIVGGDETERLGLEPGGLPSSYAVEWIGTGKITGGRNLIRAGRESREFAHYRGKRGHETGSKAAAYAAGRRPHRNIHRHVVGVHALILVGGIIKRRLNRGGVGERGDR